MDEAIRLDSAFAMAHRLASVATFNQARLGEAHRHATRAYDLRDRLTQPERWHVEAFYHVDVSLDPRRAADTYELLLSRYSGDSRAANNLGFLATAWLSDYERAYRAYLRAAELSPYSILSH